MDILNIDRPVYYHKSLLTEEEKVAAIVRLLGHSFTHHGELFKPDDSFYEWSTPQSSLQAMAKSLFRWLGVKPLRLQIDFSSNIEEAGLYVQKGSQHVILINEHYTQNPFQCAAVLSHEIMHYLLIGKKKLVLIDTAQNEHLTDLATIYGGLGIVVINGFGDNTGWVNKQWHRILGIAGRNPEYLGIGLVSPRDYAEKVISYTANSYAFADYLLPGAKRFFSDKVQAIDNPRRKSSTIRRSEQSMHSNNILTVGVVSVVLATASLGFYLAHKRPSYLPENLRVKRQEIEVLKNMYDNCIAAVAKKRAVTDQTDIFAEESINAEVNECLSIRNNHDHQVRLYNQHVRDLE